MGEITSPTQANSKSQLANKGLVRVCERELETHWWILMGMINTQPPVKIWSRLEHCVMF